MERKAKQGMLWEHLADVMRLTARVLLPVECPGCGLLDVLLCAQCRAALDCPFTPVMTDAVQDSIGQTMPVWTMASYQASMRGIILAWKDGGRRDLSEAISAAVYAATTAAQLPGKVDLVVPIPSTRAAIRRRGRLHTQELAEAVGHAVGARVAPALQRAAGSRDQVGLTRHERSQNLRGAVNIRRGFKLQKRRILLVDDILTTGSSIHESARILGIGGAKVVGAVVLAATPAAPERRDKYASTQEVE